MSCFSIFKDKSRGKQKAQSAPELEKQDRHGRVGTSSSATTRSAKSCSSMSSNKKSLPELYKEKENSLRVFSFQELKEATCGFSRMMKIGEGGFGSVYKGTVQPVSGKGDPIPVAVKKLNKHGLQGYKEWFAEVQFLSVVSHPNLVKLIGYCAGETERGTHLLLVYEYMPNRSLDEHLFNRALPPLPWKTRLEIILGAAEGLAHLHEGMEVTIIYRDFKSANVLLDENFKAKLSDFGLAREGPTDDRSHVTTAVVGTYGYAAPEYIETGHLTVSSDIWTFGVVLYELITGRRAVERSRPTKEQKLLDWVKDFPSDSKKFTMIIDPHLRNNYSLSAARRIAKLAESCLSKNPKDRPLMHQAVSTIKQAIEDTERTAPPASSSKTSTSTSTSSRRK